MAGVVLVWMYYQAEILLWGHVRVLDEGSVNAQADEA
jgi:hypothetical protein